MMSHSISSSEPVTEKLKVNEGQVQVKKNSEINLQA